MATRRGEVFFLCLCLCLLSCAIAPQCIANQRPNVLVILADDLGCRDLHVEGSTFHETPALDAFAHRPFSFAQESIPL